MLYPVSHLSVVVIVYIFFALLLNVLPHIDNFTAAKIEHLKLREA